MDGRRQFVGRHTERRLVRHLLDEAHAGRHGVLVVSGPPGVGKTALIGWLVEEVTDGTVLEIEEAAADQRFWGEAGFAAAVATVAAVLAGDPTAPVVADRARRRYHRSGHPYTAAVLAPALAALAARAGPPKLAPPATQSVGNGANFPVPTAVRVLSAVEAYDAEGVRARLGSARWRDGIAGPATLANLPVLAALVEAGDLLGDSAAVRTVLPALARAEDNGVAVVLGWPTTVARLLAIAARHTDDVSEASRHVARALQLTEHENLVAERGMVLVEAARQADGPKSAGALLREAASVFDTCSMFGWLARCEALADELGVTTEVWPARVVNDRTILTDDIVGSTAANARLGDLLYLESLRVHDRIVRSRLRELGGDEIKHTGDGVNAIFRDPVAAARCALAIQADFGEWQRAEPDLALQVRCGLARGSLIPADGDYFGLVQSAAARLCALAAPGEVLVARAVAEGVDTAPDIAADSAGRHLLRGLADKVEVYRVRPV